MYHFLNADGTSLNLVYQDDAQNGGSETIISSTYDEVNQNFMVFENYYSSTSDARFYLKKFNANGVFVAKYTYAIADFGFSPTKTITFGGFTYALGVNSNNLMIAKLDQNGDFVTTFGNNDIATIDISENITKIESVTTDGVNAIYAAAGNMGSTYCVFVMKINVNNNLSVDEFSTDNLGTLFYPNPTKGLVDFNVKVDKVSLLDINGKTMKNLKDVTNIDLSEMQNGTYFLHLTVNGKTATKKVIIQK